MNLLYETSAALRKHNKTLDDIEWIGGNDFVITKSQFIDLAAKTNYDNGYGSPQVATDLVLVGKDFYFTREEYDGSEWWELHHIPDKPNTLKLITSLCSYDGWNTLYEINQQEEDIDD